MTRNQSELAEAVRRAVIDALLEGYEDAGVRGLCGEGRFEAAVGAARTLDLTEVLSGPLSGVDEAFDLGALRTSRET